MPASVSLVFVPLSTEGIGTAHGKQPHLSRRFFRPPVPPRAKRKPRDLIVEKTDDVNRTLQNIEVILRSVPFPFPSPHKYRNVMHWVLRNALPEGGSGAALDRGIDTFQNLALLQRLVVGRLCAIALQVEKAFDLKAPA